MKQDIEKMMNEKFDNASEKEVIPFFDKEATWEELSARITVEKKRPAFVWWTYAAAVLAGILIGSVAIRLWFQPATPEPIVKTLPAPAPEVKIVTDTVYVPVPPIVIPQPVAKKKADKPIQKPKMVIAQKIQEPEPVPVKKHEPTETVIEEQPVAAAPKKVKPVHLLDIANENRSSALYHYDPAEKQRQGFVLQISTKRLPENKSPKQQSSILNGLVNK